MHADAERLDSPARPCEVLEKPGSEMRDEDVPGIAAEKTDEIGYSIVAYRKAGLLVFADQSFRPNEAAIRDNEVQILQQVMKMWFDPDKV